MPNRPNAFEIVWRNVWLRALFYTVLIIFTIYVLAHFWSGYAFALQVGLIGFTIAYILNPLVKVFARLKIPRTISVIIIYLILINFLLLGSLLISQVIVELGSFVSLLPKALADIFNFASNTPQWLSDRMAAVSGSFAKLGLDNNSSNIAKNMQDQATLILENSFTAINTQLEEILKKGPNLVISGASSIISTTLQGILIIITSAYFLYDYPKFIANTKRMMPIRWRSLYQDISNKLDKAVGGYFRGRLLISFILGVFIYIGLIIIGIPLALAITFLAVIFNLVPYLGPIIGVTPAILLGFTISPTKALLAVIVFIVANQLEGNVFAPIILSKSTNLHPVTVLLSILAGAGLFGLMGALFAVPIVAFLKLIIDDYLLKTPAYQENNEKKQSSSDELKVGLSKPEQ